MQLHFANTQTNWPCSLKKKGSKNVWKIFNAKTQTFGQTEVGGVFGFRFWPFRMGWISVVQNSRGLLTVWPQGGIYFGIFFLACCTFFGLVFFFLKIWFRKCVWLAGLAFVVCGQVEGRRASGKLITILTTLSVRTVVVIRTHESHELWLTAALELNFNCRTCCPLDKYGGHMPNGQLIRGEISPSAVDGGQLSACLRFCSTIRAADYTQ